MEAGFVRRKKVSSVPSRVTVKKISLLMEIKLANKKRGLVVKGVARGITAWVVQKR